MKSFMKIEFKINNDFVLYFNSLQKIVNLNQSFNYQYFLI